MTLSRILLGRIRPRAVINSQWRGKLLAGGTFLKGLLSFRRDAPTYQWYPNNFDVQRNKINCSGSGPVATVGHGARRACPAEMGARISETAETRTCHTGGRELKEPRNYDLLHVVGGQGCSSLLEL